MLKNRIKQILTVGSAQGAIQVIGFVSGLLIIRGLSPSEYSLYTIAFATLGTLAVISDSGLSSAFMSEAGKSDGTPKSLGIILDEATRIRKIVSLSCAAIAIPAMYYLFHSNGTHYINAAAISIAVITIYYPTLTGQLYEVVLSLTKQIYLIQRIQITGALLRLSSAIAILVIFPRTWLVILVAGVVQIYTNGILRNKCHIVASSTHIRDQNARGAMVKLVKRAMPGAIYYALSGQISVWAISIFGNSSAIAEVGVSGRLAASLTLISSVVYAVVLPRFAQRKATNHEVLKNYISIIILVAFVALFAWMSLYALKGHIDLLLGSKYAHMEYEVLLGFYATCLTLIGGVAHWFAAGRGIVVPPWLYVSLSLLLQVTALFYFDLTSARGVLTMASFLAPVQAIVVIAYTWYTLSRKSLPLKNIS
jgi:O-antigen/teichoic acid export membrane protein